MTRREEILTDLAIGAIGLRVAALRLNNLCVLERLAKGLVNERTAARQTAVPNAVRWEAKQAAVR